MNRASDAGAIQSGDRMSFADPVHLAEGYGGYRDGKPRGANPYARWTTAWTAWSAGWDRVCLTTSLGAKKPMAAPKTRLSVARDPAPHSYLAPGLIY